MKLTALGALAKTSLPDLSCNSGLMFLPGDLVSVSQAGFPSSHRGTFMGKSLNISSHLGLQKAATILCKATEFPPRREGGRVTCCWRNNPVFDFGLEWMRVAFLGKQTPPPPPHSISGWAGKHLVVNYLLASSSPMITVCLQKPQGVRFPHKQVPEFANRAPEVKARHLENGV